MWSANATGLTGVTGIPKVFILDWNEDEPELRPFSRLIHAIYFL